MLHDAFNIQPLFICNSTFVLGKSRNDGPVVLAKESRVIPDIAQALYDDPLARKALGQANCFHVFFISASFEESEKHSPSGGLESSTHTALRDGFSGNASQRIDLTWVKSSVRIHDPGHLPG